MNTKEPSSTETTSKSTSHKLSNIKKLITNLNASLLGLKKEKDQYQAHIGQCKDLCLEIRELMDATTTRIVPKPDNE